MEILGSGKDAIVVYPPVDCEIGANIDKNDYVGKIYLKGRDIKYFTDLVDKINRLPDKYDGILYYKENYLCNINPQNIDSQNIDPETKNYYRKNLSKNQLILKRVKGDTLSETIKHIIDDIKNDNNCSFYDVLKASIEAYYYIKDLASLNVYYNDYSSDNVMYDNNNKKLMLVDLDDISYDTPKRMPKILYFNRLRKTYNENYYYDDKYGYGYWNKIYISDIVKQFLLNVFMAYDKTNDAFMFNDFDETTKDKFIYVKDKIENIIGKKYNQIDDTDIELINNNLINLKDELCKNVGGKKIQKHQKTKKTKKTKKKVYKKKNRSSKKFK